MSKDGRTREEHVALNRVDLYREIYNDPAYLVRLRIDMENKNLACWCKSNKKLVSCHGDNFVHILSPELADRDWTKSVTVCLVDDLRRCFLKLYHYAMVDVAEVQFLPSYFDWAEMRFETTLLIDLMKKDDWDLDEAHYLLACLVIDLELAIGEGEQVNKNYRLRHANWILNTVFHHWTDRAHEPSPPNPVIIKPKKNKE